MIEAAHMFGSRANRVVLGDLDAGVAGQFNLQTGEVSLDRSVAQSTNSNYIAHVIEHELTHAEDDTKGVDINDIAVGLSKRGELVDMEQLRQIDEASVETRAGAQSGEGVTTYHEEISSAKLDFSKNGVNIIDFNRARTAGNIEKVLDMIAPESGEQALAA